ncbi:MAG: tetratricopeptide repeat protein [Verrucomicrobia bacterium]|nr:tetratricopeptide repeat protein [Verrucomicrobiota bacterium]MBU1734584.1 tetratricopeptide repeat protein [Verrucomicrobiota bacterium]MBU1856237.1 tetratricopeptide repeat protein [Verrucomicrobiota bacterium]
MSFCRIETRPYICLALLAALVFLAGNTGLSAEDGLAKIHKLRKQGEYAQAAKECRRQLERKSLDEAERKNLMLELAADYQFDSQVNRSAEAGEAYLNFLNLWPDDPLAAQAHFNLARCLEFIGNNREHDLDEARMHYRTVYEKFPGSIWADQAYFWLAMSYSKELNKETAAATVERLKDFDQRFPNSALKAVVAAELSEFACAYLDDYDMAIESGLKAMNYGIRSHNMKATLRYRLAYLYQFKKGNPENALKWYREIVDASPTKSDYNYFVALERIGALEGKLKGAKAPKVGESKAGEAVK